MSLDALAKILNKFSNQEIRRVNFFWRGEPTLHRFLPEMVDMAKKRGYETYISTNTVTKNLGNREYVSKLLASLDKLTVCVDGYNQKTLSKYRIGSNWGTLIKNLETISSIETDCFKEMRTLMFRYNENHENDFMGLAVKYNMDSLSLGLPIINAKQELTQKEADKWLARRPKYQRYQKERDRWIHKTTEGCIPIPIITVTGEVAICCYDWKIRYSLGNILRDSLKTINKRIEKIIPLATEKKLSICSKDCFLSRIVVNIKKTVKKDV